MTHKIADIWGRVTEEERAARRGVLSTIRLALSHGITPPSGLEHEARLREIFAPIDARLASVSSVSEAYGLLTEEGQTDVRHTVHNPAVRVSIEGRDPYLEAETSVLDRLERGQFVGPVDEKQLVRQPGDKAF